LVLVVRLTNDHGDQRPRWPNDHGDQRPTDQRPTT